MVVLYWKVNYKRIILNKEDINKDLNKDINIPKQEANPEEKKEFKNKLNYQRFLSFLEVNKR